MSKALEEFANDIEHSHRDDIRSNETNIYGILKLLAGILGLFGIAILILLGLLVKQNTDFTSFRASFDKISVARTTQLNTQQDEITNLAGYLKIDNQIIQNDQAEIARLDTILATNNIKSGISVPGSNESPPFQLGGISLPPIPAPSIHRSAKGMNQRPVTNPSLVSSQPGPSLLQPSVYPSLQPSNTASTGGTTTQQPTPVNQPKPSSPAMQPSVSPTPTCILNLPLSPILPILCN